MQRLKLFIPLVLFVVLGVLLMGSLIQGNNKEVPSALIDKPVPEFSLDLLMLSNDSPEPIKVTNESLKGQPYLLNAWATWCQPCRIEHPTIVELANQGINIIGLNYKDEQTKARQWLVDLENPYSQVIYDQQGRLGLDLGVTGIPETYFVDAQGIIRYKHVGIINEKVWASRLRAIWQRISAGSAVN